MSTIRAVPAELRSKSRRGVGGMELEDDGLHLDDLPEADAEELGFMDNCKAKGGAVFAVGQATGDTESCELTGANFRAVTERTAKKSGRGSGEGGHGRGPRSTRGDCPGRPRRHQRARGLEGRVP